MLSWLQKPMDQEFVSQTVQYKIGDTGYRVWYMYRDRTYDTLSLTLVAGKSSRKHSTWANLILFGQVDVPFVHIQGRHGCGYHRFPQCVAPESPELTSASRDNALPSLRWESEGARESEAGAGVLRGLVEDVFSSQLNTPGCNSSDGCDRCRSGDLAQQLAVWWGSFLERMLVDQEAPPPIRREVALPRSCRCQERGVGTIPSLMGVVREVQGRWLVKCCETKWSAPEQLQLWNNKLVMCILWWT